MTHEDMAGQAAPATPRWATLDDAARYARVHPRTLRRAVAAGRLPAYRLGRLLRVDLRDVDALLRPVARPAR